MSSVIADCRLPIADSRSPIRFGHIDQSTIGNWKSAMER
jgi:hypothetical protein